MKYNNSVVLAVFAHPDDDELSCFGTLARLQRNGFQVHILELTSGERSINLDVGLRLIETKAAAQIAGLSVITASSPDGMLKFDINAISLVDRHMRELLPRIVITHYPQELGHGHQDHVAVSSAAVNAARRCKSVDWILYAEPPVQAWGFNPNYFVDITDYIDLKKQAVLLHQSEKDKPYMRPEIIDMRAHWWASYAGLDDLNNNRYYEAFTIVKGVSRQEPATLFGL